jgi:hypothetical protein
MGPNAELRPELRPMSPLSDPRHLLYQIVLSPTPKTYYFHTTP